jgi:hypothetical protein
MNELISHSLRYGSREKFMIELSFEDDPEPGRNTSEEVASWGHLKFWVNGVNLCAHYEAGEIRESVAWNWWGVLAWLVENWDPLFHEQALPAISRHDWAADAIAEINHPDRFLSPSGWNEEAENKTDAWFRRHCLWASRDGGLVPYLVFRRFFDQIEISWSEIRPMGCPDHFRFLSATGGMRLPIEEVVEPLNRFLRHACRLVTLKSKSEKAAELERRVLALENVEFFDRRLTWLAGFKSETAGSFQRFKERLTARAAECAAGIDSILTTFFPTPKEGLAISGHCHGALMFGAVAPELSDDDRLTIALEMLSHRIAPESASHLLALIDTLAEQFEIDPAGSRVPWEEGYELADAWSEVSGLTSPGPVNIEEHLQELGITVHEVTLSGSNTSGAAILMEGRAPLILVNKLCERHLDANGGSQRSGLRFTLAHELCHLLADRHRGSELAMVSGDWAPRSIEQRANAFAAALLMPDSAISSAYDDCPSQPADGVIDDFLKVAKTLEVSPDALSWHLYNRRFIDETERDNLRRQLINRP